VPKKRQKKKSARAVRRAVRDESRMYIAITVER
jgi:hypothetical protein